jgi:hypothetical protein
MRRTTGPAHVHVDSFRSSLQMAAFGQEKVGMISLFQEEVSSCETLFSTIYTM